MYSIFEKSLAYIIVRSEMSDKSSKSISAWINSKFLFSLANRLIRVFFSPLFLLALFLAAAGDIERCPVGDTDCIRKVSNKVLEISGRLGHNGINLLPIDPLHIPNIIIKQGAESPVNIELNFKDVDLIGLSAHRFVKLT